MRLGYNTNGLAHHSLPSAIRLLSSLGYESVAITLDHYALNPYAPGFDQQLRDTKAILDELQMRSVVETGARYLLDPRQKHVPTLVSSKEKGRPLRIEFLRHAVDIAATLGSDCVSLWSGVLAAGDSRDDGFRRLIEGLQIVLDYAQRKAVKIGFEPEPGMLIDTMESFTQLIEQIDSPHLGLTLDIGHLHCLKEPIAESIMRWSNRLVNIHLEDMRVGVHEHLMFGEGEIDFPATLAALQQINYDGGVHVELSRHSHCGPDAARRSMAFLQPLLLSTDHERHETHE